uniref:DUF819 domain-containing protein n=1 Tax=Odontella aurita TaxID=265563 RepID=A0A6U6CH16_9STRA|mmetsp:Transcript_13123/g.38605  ORF Transcript_13123/g.38605 Transcript_13123/m.38605 type:complete len:509 (+) Transcript_13123:80-1606(+)|eukprot:CAMPEP_0113564684 /NCGR_PEP_ID=MMETSP0015_2-20120614/21756_1 /TAXON_ID=2838 /ORGANISM="Odontella" /LENGTH=508 /DNA_ID=CAMNT_0000466793 /DNA_START=17 /DNA_END=1543 /DNA_ORIENTATION=- /assembly_acc=CAM_ASM_000160
MTFPHVFNGSGLPKSFIHVVFVNKSPILFFALSFALIDRAQAFSVNRANGIANIRPSVFPISKANIHRRVPVQPHLAPFQPFKFYGRCSSEPLSKLSLFGSLDPGRLGGSCNALATHITSARAALHVDPSFVLSSILLLSVFGISLERRTTLGKALSAPLATMALALIVANFGLVPFSSPIYSMINQHLVPLAVPLLLFDSDLRRVISDTGSLLLAFVIGAISTMIGTVVAFPLIPLKALGSDEGWRVASALAARHIGGAINFVAVADTLSISGSVVSAAIAADNVVVALYFAFLFYLAKSDEVLDTDQLHVEEGENKAAAIREETNSITMASLGTSITVASCLVTLGKILTNVLLPRGTSPLPLTSVLTVAAATTFPGFFSCLRETGSTIGILFMQMFFAASGAAGSIALVLKTAPSLFIFSALQIAVHFVSLVSLGKYVFRLDEKELYLASNANVGGPTTAAAMAQAKNWQRLVLPALLIGILGYATATPIALVLGPHLLRLKGFS